MGRKEKMAIGELYENDEAICLCTVYLMLFHYIEILDTIRPVADAAVISIASDITSKK
jgi:hypothetical protein